MQTRSIQAKQSFKNNRVSLASFYSTWIKRYKTSMTETYIWKSNNYLRHILLNLLSSSSILWIYFLSILKRQKERKAACYDVLLYQILYLAWKQGCLLRCRTGESGWLASQRHPRNLPRLIWHTGNENHKPLKLFIATNLIHFCTQYPGHKLLTDWACF